jgi:phenylacetate-CoA ligase
MSLEDRLYPLLAAYERLPDGVRRAIGSGYRRLPRRLRYGAGHAHFDALARDGEGWTPEAVRTYQFEQLRHVLLAAQRDCPLYGRRFAEAGFDPARMQAPEDLARCPTLEKRDLVEHRDELTSRAVPASQRLYITTGGSTGVPVGFYLERGVSRPKEQAFLDGLWRRAGYEPGDRVAVLRGGVVSSVARGAISRYDATRDWLVLSSYHLAAERLHEYVEALVRFRPAFLHAYPSAALQLAELLERTGTTLRVPLRGLLCGSERLTDLQKALLERRFGCRVYRWYGHSERVVLAGEGRRSGLFYFSPQYGHVEFGPPDEDGLCEVIGTSFHNLAMPLIRYRTGDRVRPADPATQALEFPWLAASEIAGREQEFLVSATQRHISLTAFNMHDAVFDGLYAVQFFQDEPGRAEFRYLPGPAFDDARLPGIRAAIARKLGDDFAVTLRRVDAVERTPRGKHRWLVSGLADA